MSQVNTFRYVDLNFKRLPCVNVAVEIHQGVQCTADNDVLSTLN